MEAERPEILRGVQGHCEVRFTYEFKGGASGYVSGHFSRALGNEADGITGIEVKVGPASKLPADVTVPESGLVKFSIGRITPDAGTGLIIPVSKKEMATGTGAARYVRPSSARIRYALSLCNRDDQAGGGNFYRPTEAELRAMSPAELGEWIGMAEFELGIR